MKLLKLELLGAWVLKHREDARLPVPLLKKEISEKYGLFVFDDSLSSLSIVFDENEYSEETIKEKIKVLFEEAYLADEWEKVVTCTVSEYVQQNASSLEKNISHTTTEDGAESDQIEKVMQTVNAMLAGDEFKDLAKELKQIAPQIIQNKTFDAFSYQTYLFSINEGYGLTTYLTLLSELLSSLKIKPVSTSGVVEEKLPHPKGDSIEPFADIFRTLRHGKKDFCQVLCIDISEWMNEIRNRLFKEFLLDVEKHMNEFVIVFRVPFVDKEILSNIHYALNDLMFVRMVTFPPFAQDEIQKCAQTEFEKYGFKMSAAAWTGFHERISEEKSDGKFYGVNTIKKVVRELLYKKQLSNARRGINDQCISKKDTASICTNSNNIGLSGYEMLDKLVGGEVFKNRISEIIAQIEMTRADPSLPTPCIHMRFVGNPGTGKTTVARIVGKILKEKGVLRIGNFYEYAGRDFCGRYIGETAPKTSSMCRDAYGSVLFIDEAYSLYRGDGNDRDYGREALDTLIAEMENHRSDLVVIMAGYTDDMDKLMQGNAGLASRMPYVIEFPNFTREQLFDIFVSMVKGRFKYDDDFLPIAKEYFYNIPDEVIHSKEFSNARFVRNLFERTWAKASMRCQLGKIGTITLTKDDFERSTGDKEFTFIMKKKNKIGFA